MRSESPLSKDSLCQFLFVLGAHAPQPEMWLNCVSRTRVQNIARGPGRIGVDNREWTTRRALCTVKCLRSLFGIRVPLLIYESTYVS